MLKLRNKNNFCPHLDEPFEDCYCTKMNSQDIERTVYLCTGHYKICDIYNNGDRITKEVITQ